MFKHKIFNYILVVLLLVTVGCDDDKKNEYETGTKVVSLIQKNDDKTLSVVVDPAKMSTLLIQAKLDGRSAYDIVAQAEARLDLVDEYNQIHGTAYEKINPSSYVFERSEFIFPKYSELSSQIEFSFSAQSMATDVSYLLPVQITELRGDENAVIDENSDIIYVMVSKLPPPALVHLKDVELTTEIGADKKNWFAAYATNSQGGHTFSVEEAAKQSMFMDFVLLKHGANLRIHPSIIGWQHKGDYQKYVAPYVSGFEKFTHVCNMNKLFTPELFDSVNSSEAMAAKIAELRATDGYNYYAADRMTSHNLQSQIAGNNRVLILGWGPKIGKNEQFAFLHIKEVTAIDGGANYTMKFDVKYIDFDMKTEALNTQGQTVIVDNPDYVKLN